MQRQELENPIRDDRAAYNEFVQNSIQKFETAKHPENKKAQGVFLAEYIHHHHRAEWLLSDENKLQYRTMLQTLMTNRKAPGLALTDEELNIVLLEGVRLLVPNILKYYILRKITGIEPLDAPPAPAKRGQRQAAPTTPPKPNSVDIREGVRAAAQWARHSPEEFQRSLYEVSEYFLRALDPGMERTYLVKLSFLCQKAYFVVNAPITPEMEQTLESAISDIGVTNVFQIADDLAYPKLYLMLAQYYAARVKTRPEFKNEVDHVIRAYKALQQLNQYSKEMQTVIASIDKQLVELSETRLKNQDPSGLTASYRSIAAENAGPNAVVSKLLQLAQDPSLIEAFKAAFNYYLCVLPYQTADKVSLELIDCLKQCAAKDIVCEARSNYSDLQKQSKKYPGMLQYCHLVEGGSRMLVEHQGQTLDVSPVSFNSVYMLVTKTTGQEDNYKFYAAFNPTDAQNYVKCWSVLVDDVLMHENVYGVKMVSPKEAVTAYKFPGYEDRSKHSGQPGKMAIVYFKRYEDVRQIKGENYSEHDYRIDNLRVIFLLEEKLTAWRVTKNPQLVVPDHSLPLSQFVAKGEHPYSFVSGDTGGSEHYVISDQRAENTMENNPYMLAMKAVEEAERLKSAAISAAPMPSSLSSSSNADEPEPKAPVQAPRYRKRDIAKYFGLLFGGIVFLAALTFLIVSTAGASVPVVAGIVGAIAAAFNATVLATSIGLICATALGAIGFGAGYIWTAYKDHKKQKAQLQLMNEPVVEPAPALEATISSTAVMQTQLAEAQADAAVEAVEVVEPAVEAAVEAAAKLADDKIADSLEEPEPPKMEGDESQLEAPAEEAPAEEAPPSSMCSLM